MKVIAKTSNGLLIEGTVQEVGEILKSVQGVKPEEINIGQRIAAIDYASTITKLSSLADDYDYKKLMACVKKFNKSATDLEQAVTFAANLKK